MLYWVHFTPNKFIAVEYPYTLALSGNKSEICNVA